VLTIKNATLLKKSKLATDSLGKWVIKTLKKKKIFGQKKVKNINYCYPSWKSGSCATNKINKKRCGFWYM
jgi:hypothetical protein